MSFMNEVPAELMREYGNRQNFSNPTVIMAAMKEMFRDALQQVMESELDSTWVMKKANERYKVLSNRREKTIETLPLGFPM
jgi:ketol-acid reductoisomerase